MKILILNKWLIVGGVEKILINYLNIFNDMKDIEIDLALLFDTNESVFSDLIPNNVNTLYIFDKNYFYLKQEIYQNRKKNIINRVREKIFKLSEERKIKSKIYDIISKGNYDLVISFSEHFDKYIPFDKISFLSIRWFHSEVNLNKFSNRKINILKKYGHAITITNEMQKQVEYLGINKEKITTLYNPIDFSDIQEKSACGSEIKFLTEPYLLQVSRLVDGKGHIELLEIYAILKKLGVTHKLYFIGDGDNRKNLENKIKELELTNDCFLLGEITNPYPYFKNADLFVHTSESEGLPTVLLESMALGVPVVAMDCPTGPKDILGANSEYGKLIPMHNKEMFVEAVMELLNNDTLWQDYSRKSLERIQDFSSEKIAQQIDAIFKQMIKKDI